MAWAVKGDEGADRTPLSACRQHEVYRLMSPLPSAERVDSDAHPTSHAFLLVYAVAGLMSRATRTFPAHRAWSSAVVQTDPGTDSHPLPSSSGGVWEETLTHAWYRFRKLSGCMTHSRFF